MGMLHHMWPYFMEEISADKRMYDVRQSEVDPYHPPIDPDVAKTVRGGRGILRAHWPIYTHELIREKACAGQNFGVVADHTSAGILP